MLPATWRDKSQRLGRWYPVKFETNAVRPALPQAFAALAFRAIES